MVFFFCKCPQVSRTLLSILADLRDADVSMVSTCFLISNSSRPFINPLRIVPSAPTTISITIIFIFHCLFSCQARSRYLNFLSFSFNFIRWSTGIIIIIIIIIIFYSLQFFTSALADGFSLELSDSKSPQVSRTRLGILAVLSNAVVWIVSTANFQVLQVL